MAKIKSLEFFKGQLSGIYQKVWVAISENNNLFTTSDLEYDQNSKPDIKNTKWKYISNERYSQIIAEMYLFRKTDFEVSRNKKSNGLSI